VKKSGHGHGGKRKAGEALAEAMKEEASGRDGGEKKQKKKSKASR